MSLQGRGEFGQKMLAHAQAVLCHLSLCKMHGSKGLLYLGDSYIVLELLPYKCLCCWLSCNTTVGSLLGVNEKQAVMLLLVHALLKHHSSPCVWAHHHRIIAALRMMSHHCPTAALQR